MTEGLKSKLFINKRELVWIVFVSLVFFDCMEYYKRTTRNTTNKIKAIQNRKCSKSDRRCLVYDRPPRTGSTTIEETLGKCMHHKGYKGAQWLHSGNRTMGILEMLSFNYLNRSSVRPHIYMTHQDHKRIISGCDCLFYITSIAPMEERLISRYKYGLREGHGNSTFKLRKLNRKVNRHLSSQKYRDQLLAEEQRYHLYPYINGKVNENERIVPQYVIRKKHLKDDLRLLLNALNCQDTPITSNNVHRSSSGSSKFNESTMQRLKNAISRLLRTKDYRFKKLAELSETRNSLGLKVAENY